MEVIAIANQKGGVGKTTTTASLGVGLATKGYKVLMIDLDPQASLTYACGINPDEQNENIVNVINLMRVDSEREIPDKFCTTEILKNLDLITADITLAGLEVELISETAREQILRGYINALNNKYDYVLIDCAPSLGVLTLNALTAANSVIIPVQAEYLSSKGIDQLMHTIQLVRRKLNLSLSVKGVLFTMVNSRTNEGRLVMQEVQGKYGIYLRVFDTFIPRSVRVAEAARAGKPLYSGSNKVAEAYQALVQEVTND